ncbi:hypothetical protein Tco_0229401 [Tanacetum coccineum]
MREISRREGLYSSWRFVPPDVEGVLPDGISEGVSLLQNEDLRGEFLTRFSNLEDVVGQMATRISRTEQVSTYNL